MFLRTTNALLAALLVCTLFAGGCGIFGEKKTESAGGWMDGELLSTRHLEGVPMLQVKTVACSEGLEEMLGRQSVWPAIGGGVGAKPGDRLRATVTVSKGGAVVVKSIKRLAPVFVERELKIQRQWRGPYSGRKEAGTEIVSTKEDFEKLWKVMNSVVVPRPSLPDVDFEKDVIVAAFMGEFPSGGYSIDIEKAVEKEKEVVVHIVRRHPAKGSVVTKAFTRPYSMVAFENTGKPITFSESNIGGR